MLFLLIDIGSTFTKANLFNLDKLELVVKAITRTNAKSDISLSIKNIFNQLETKNISLSNIQHSWACSSAAGGLKMVVIGLVPELTAEAAKKAALGAGAKISKVFTQKLTQVEIKEIANISPDLILLSGGTDGGNEEVVLKNSELISRSDIKAPVLIACNKVVAEKVQNKLKKTQNFVSLTENVMPELNELNIIPARRSIRKIFLDQIIQAKGISKVEKYIDEIKMPTPAAVMKVTELISQGNSPNNGYGELMTIDLGGATTDVHSAAKGEPTINSAIIKGLREPFLKRTVEGDIGMRFNAPSLLNNAGKDTIWGKLFDQIEEEKLLDYVEHVKNEPGYLAKSELEKDIDKGLAITAIAIAIKRHCGEIKTKYTPIGKSYIQRRKDLTNLDLVIGTGGILANNKDSKQILESALQNDDKSNLTPRQPQIMIDKHYIMSSIGLLTDHYEQKAYDLANKYILNHKEVSNGN